MPTALVASAEQLQLSITKHTDAQQSTYLALSAGGTVLCTRFWLVQ